MNRAHTLQMAAPGSLRKSPIVLWSGTSWPGPAPAGNALDCPLFKADRVSLHVSREKRGNLRLVESGWGGAKVVRRSGAALLHAS